MLHSLHVVALVHPEISHHLLEGIVSWRCKQVLVEEAWEPSAPVSVLDHVGDLDHGHIYGLMPLVDEEV